MPFTKDVKEVRFKAANGKCECENPSHGHEGRCSAELSMKKLGKKGPDAWEAHHDVPESNWGSDSYSNCRVFCRECFEKSGNQ